MLSINDELGEWTRYDTHERYLLRLIDEDVTDYLHVFGAISIAGPRGCGKTWAASNHANSKIDLGSRIGNFQNRRLVELDSSVAFSGEYPRLIDGWQVVPSLWDATRSEFDTSNVKGRFILTGSSTPVTKGVEHTGIGRIGEIRMHTMSLFETGDSKSSVSLKKLFGGSFETTRVSGGTLDNILRIRVRGGWTENLGVPDRLCGLYARDYVYKLIAERMGIDNPVVRVIFSVF